VVRAQSSSARACSASVNQVRAKLGQFHFTKDLADNLIGSLSGGEKARLLFAFMSFDTPHLLLLDEPTNHLDIEAREALVQALNSYKGAVVMVSHDPHMVERVADRLWLIADGKCEPFDGDLQDYRRHVIAERRNARARARAERKDSEAAAAQESPAPKKQVNPQAVQKLEKEIARLAGDKQKLEAQMAEQGFFSDPARAQKVQADYAALTAQLQEKEERWLDAAG
jgi:ATP-binding cassette subfamily F protein 3